MSAEPRAGPRRITGLWIVLGGIGLIGGGILFGRFAREGLALTGLGAVGVLIGTGCLIRPWSAEMVAANNDPKGNFAEVWRLMPLFWKLWFVFSVLGGLAVMLAFFIWW